MGLPAHFYRDALRALDAPPRNPRIVPGHPLADGLIGCWAAPNQRPVGFADTTSTVPTERKSTNFENLAPLGRGELATHWPHGASATYATMRYDAMPELAAQAVGQDAIPNQSLVIEGSDVTKRFMPYADGMTGTYLIWVYVTGGDTTRRNLSGAAVSAGTSSDGWGIRWETIGHTGFEAYHGIWNVSTSDGPTLSAADLHGRWWRVGVRLWTREVGGNFLKDCQLIVNAEPQAKFTAVGGPATYVGRELYLGNEGFASAPSGREWAGYWMHACYWNRILSDEELALDYNSDSRWDILEEDYPPPAVSGPKTYILGRVTETTLARPVTSLKARPIDRAVDSSLSQAFGRQKSLELARAAAAESAQPFSALKTRDVSPAAETDEAQPVTTSGKAASIGRVAETSLAQTLERLKTRAISREVETGLTQLVSRLKELPIGPAVETETSRAFVASKSRDIVPAADTNEAQAVTTPGTKIAVLGFVSEPQVTQAVGRLKERPIGQVTEADIVQALTAAHVVEISPALEAELVVALSRLKERPIGTVLEIGQALPLSESGMVVIARQGQKTTTLFSASRTWAVYTNSRNDSE